MEGFNSQEFRDWAEIYVTRRPAELKRHWLMRAYKSWPKAKGGGRMTLFGKQFDSEVERKAFWDTLMRVLDKKLTDSGLSLSHVRIPTNLFSDWLARGGSRSSLLGMKDFTQFDTFIDDAWTDLVRLEGAPAPEQPLSPDSLPAPSKDYKCHVERVLNDGQGIQGAAAAQQQFIQDADMRNILRDAAVLWGQQGGR